MSETSCCRRLLFTVIGDKRTKKSVTFLIVSFGTYVLIIWKLCSCIRPFIFFRDRRVDIVARQLSSATEVIVQPTVWMISRIRGQRRDC